MSLSESAWEDLLYAIYEKKCTPFLGAGASYPWLPLGSNIAQKWAEKFHYPLDDHDNLSRVAQFLAIENREALLPKKFLKREIKHISTPDFALDKFRYTLPSILADLNLPLYITTNYDHFLEEALRGRGREPTSEFCRWNNFARTVGIRSVFEDEDYNPTVAQPLVYHLHGEIDIPQSMVLTESDYIDFLVSLIKDTEQEIIPNKIRKVLAETTVLFIGYSLEDINFRTIFRSITNLLGINAALTNIAILMPPAEIDEERKNNAMKYLETYAEYMLNVRIHWANNSNFSEELYIRFNRFIEVQRLNI
jgi:hypothetical protein